MSEFAFQSRRTSKTYRQTINAKSDVVFPLLCPVREAEWLDGWQYTMMYSASGLVEKGAVFSTASPGEAPTVWLVTRHDPRERVVEFARFTPQSRTCFLRIAVCPYGQERSYVDISYTYTSIAAAGNQFLDEWTEEKFLDGVIFWEESMNHFLKTEGLLKRDNIYTRPSVGKGE